MDLIICSEMFAISKSSINKVFKFFVVVNEVFRCQILWPKEEEFFQVMADFKEILCGLQFVHGEIDYTYIHIQKPKGAFATDHFSYKSKVHNI
jgi:hypothetical protein